MTPEELKTIEERANAISKGRVDRVFGLYGNIILRVEGFDDTRTSIADEVFIAHSFTDIPALVAEVKRLRKALVRIAYGSTIIGVGIDGTPMKGPLDKVQAMSFAEAALRGER